MFRGVTDLNVNFLGNWGFLPGVSHHVFRPIGVRATHEAFTPSHVPPLYAALPFQLSHQDILASRSVSLHGLRATDLPREPARHRNLSARPSGQALSSWHTRSCCQEYPGRCQRIPRLAQLRRLRDEPDPDGQNALHQRSLRRGAGTDGLRTGYYDQRPVLERLAVGTLPPGEG